MKSLNSSTAIAAAESSMDDHRHTSPKSISLTTATTQPASNLRDEIDDGPNAEDGGDPAVWAAFSENFRQVQSVLDRNRVLIQQVNENHRSKIHDNMVKNVALIQEINGNISKIASLYANLSANFLNVCHQRSAAGDAKNNSESEKK